MEKEAFPWVPLLLEKLLFNNSIPIVIDYDDAIFHQYDQNKNFLVKPLFSNKIYRIMSQATIVISGNQYIADYANLTGVKQIEILPTVVDTDVYIIKNIFKNDKFTIGWIGSPSTSRHLKIASSALKQLCKYNDVQFNAIGALPKDLVDIPGQLIPWNDQNEIQQINRFDVGIMPLPDTPWENGKCGFKLIQYMAARLPVIASPVGVNSEIVDHGVNGFLARNTEEWVKYFEILRKDPDLRKKMGKTGRDKVEKFYSLKVVAPRLLTILKNASNI